MIPTNRIGADVTADLVRELSGVDTSGHPREDVVAAILGRLRERIEAHPDVAEVESVDEQDGSVDGRHFFAWMTLISGASVCLDLDLRETAGAWHWRHHLVAALPRNSKARRSGP